MIINNNKTDIVVIICVAMVSFFVNCLSFGHEGPGIGGGGNTTCGDIPVSSVQQMINPREYEPLKKAWTYVDKLNEIIKQTSREDVRRYFNYFLTHKNWFLYNCKFKPLTNSQVGTNAPLGQAIRQFAEEIQISYPLIVAKESQNIAKKFNGKESVKSRKSSKEERSNYDFNEGLKELLLREQLEALLLLSRDSSYNQCVLLAGDSRWCEDNSKDIKNKLALDSADHLTIRKISTTLIKNFNSDSPFSYEEIIKILIINKFDFYSGFLIGALPKLVFNADTIESWMTYWRNHQELVKKHPHLNKCGDYIEEFKKSEKPGVYTMKVRYKENIFYLKLYPYINEPSNPLDDPFKYNYLFSPTIFNGQHITVNEQYQIFSYYHINLSEDKIVSRKIGDRYIYINLLFQKEPSHHQMLRNGYELIPQGFGFYSGIVNRVVDNGFSGIPEEDVICFF